ncbi:YegS/Rv2252/BmrU family lipid kinase [Halobacillus yeomjeoni]|uniref:YegS/Rv2252/BmrU family lipid kinase n=1 Tax=Halobacillus yeomjeoni TaxID=311194 RepID=A0A931HY74_9BACI|nr:YegS/Rv2252/BmrU family lipid kinase [Halobacillus yeomjeoni]MBH0231580.1 YegS/Rv2252/BmrU family lipid kinase [Halobacillus yeomjeoni]MCA0985098.1 YegS/Rv2252/BmrU family lipid kinase [Halobacillus yeomjeoni]
MARYQNGLFLYNGNSDSNEMENNLSQTLPIISQQVKQLQVIQTHSLDELKSVCVQYGPDVDVFFILGGDGTVHECINSLAELEKRPVIGILPGGTCNDFSRVLGIPQNMNQAARTLIEGEEFKVDAGMTENHYFINFWGIGLVTQTSFNIDPDQKSRLGVLSYFISALKTMKQADPFEFRVTIDGKEVSGEAVMILVMNGQFIGTRRLPVPSIHLNDSNLDLLIIKNSSLTLFKELLTMRQPGADESRFQELYHTQGKEIEIDVESSRDVDMDGEIKGHTPAGIKVLPEHFTFLSNQEGILPDTEE